MIDAFSEDLIEVRTLADKAFQNRIAPATLYRWIRHGSHGVRLEAVKAGRKWLTTEAAFNRFLTARTETALSASHAPTDADDATLPEDVTEDELRACKLI